MAVQLAVCSTLTKDRPIAFLAMLGVFLLLSLTSFGDYLNSRGYDRIASLLQMPDDAVRPILVAIDDDSLELLGRWPWPRRHLAGLLHTLSGFGVERLALDVLLVDRSDGDNDRVLVSVVRNIDCLILAIAPHQDDQNFALEPWPELREAVSELSHSVAEIDDDFMVRRIAGSRQIGESSWPSLAQALADGETGNADLLAPYPRRPPFDQVSAAAVLAGAIDPTVFKDRVVLIGVTAAGLAPLFAIPGDRMVSGVELQAFHTSALVNNIVWTQAETPIRTLIWALLFVMCACCLRQQFVAAATLVLLAVLALVISRTALLNHGTWLAPMPAILAMSIVVALW